MLIVILLLLALTGARIALSGVERKALPGAAATRIRSIGETIEVVIIAACAVFLVIRPFCAQAFYIPSLSMAPTLQVNDRLIVNKLAYRFGSPKRYDVVVFRAPARAVEDPLEADEKDFVKRVVGLPGDTVEVREGRTYVNGDPISDPTIAESPQYEMAPYTVPKNKLFVLGDNRNHSNDSHRWGALDSDSVIGKASFIFWPPSRSGIIR